MSSTWKIRIILILGVFVMFFGDFLGYGNASDDKKHSLQRRNSILGTTGEGGGGGGGAGDDNKENNLYKPLQKPTLTTIPSISSINSNLIDDDKEIVQKFKVGETLRDACLPKLLCEMAARPWSTLSDKERDLLNLIKSTTMTLSVALAPTKWHFAAHMGQLLRTSDESATVGCAQLWPTCPFSSKKLLSISTKFAFK